jgi:glycosyltransferase involved in cell wall biosynthesis
MGMRLRIAYLAIIDITAEGAETRHVFEICENWHRLGHDVSLFVPNSKGEPSQKLGIQIVKVATFGLKQSFHLTLVFNIMSILYLLREFSRKGIDIAYSRQSMLEFIPLSFMKWLGVRYIAEVNGIDSEQKRLFGLAKWKIRLSECLYGVSYRLADAVVTVTEEIRDYLYERYPATKGKTYVVSNGANIAISRPVKKEDACRALGFDPDRIYFVFVGSLKKWHGLENAISVIEGLIKEENNLRLLIIGDGPQKPHLQEIVRKSGLEGNVIFFGKVRFSQVALYIGTSTACLALFDRERNDRTGLSPLKIFEYMACGKPVVTTDVGNLRRIIDRHNCGLVVQPGDIDAMSEALMKLVRDPDLAKALGENGRKAAVAYYSWSAISKEVLDIMIGKNKGKQISFNTGNC